MDKPKSKLCEMNRSKMVSIQKHNKRNQQRKANMKILKEAIRNDPERYEEYKRKERERYHKRKVAGKIKGINEVSESEKKKIRKNWRNRSKKSYESKKEKKMLNVETPPVTPSGSPLIEYKEIDILENFKNSHESSRSTSIDKTNRRKNVHHLKNEIKELKKKLKKAELNVAKYKNRFHHAKHAIIVSEHIISNVLIKVKHLQLEV